MHSSTLIPSTLLYLLLILPFTAAQLQKKCRLLREHDCPPFGPLPDRIHQIDCWARANPLSHVIDCVKRPHYTRYCNHFIKTPFEIANNLPDDCVNPLGVISFAAKSMGPICRKSFAYGAIERCSRKYQDDPGFRSCICMLTCENRLEQLAKCFNGLGEPVCNAFSNIKCRRLKRPPIPLSRRQSEDYQSPRLNDTNDFFYIDWYGRPIFVDANDNVEPDSMDLSQVFPLVHYDHYYQAHAGPAIQRCYVYPYSDHIWCTQWLIPDNDETDYSYAKGPRTGFYEGPTSGVQSSIAHTRTTAPSIAAAPSVDLAKVTTPTGPLITVAPTSIAATDADADGDEASFGVESTANGEPTETATSRKSGRASSLTGAAAAPFCAVICALALFI